MKKDYKKPAMQVVKMQTAQMLAGTLNSVGGNADINYNGGGSGPARSREGGSWDDEE